MAAPRSLRDFREKKRLPPRSRWPENVSTGARRAGEKRCPAQPWLATLVDTICCLI
jgi:hypothetical protein